MLCCREWPQIEIRLLGLVLCLNTRRKKTQFAHIFFVEMILLGQLERGYRGWEVPTVPVFLALLSAKNKGLLKPVGDGDNKEIRTAPRC